MSKFKVGDRVKFTDKSFKHLYNKTGTIIYTMEYEYYEYFFLFESDEYIGGMAGVGKGKQGHCFWVSENEVQLLNDIKIDQSLVNKFMN